jgi:small redox-active disulfide protein 2
MIIEIFGTGCTKCRLLEERARLAVRKSKVSAEVVKITDLGEIIARGVMFTPAMYIDGKEMVSGRVPDVNEIIGSITANLVKTRSY